MVLPLLRRTDTKPLVFGHRGASEEFPENTILSFDMAVKQGAIGIETDLQYTRDGQIVCFHDKSLGRLTGEPGTIHSSTLKDLSKITIRHRKTMPQPIPTLHDLLQWLPAENLLILELKDRRFSEASRLENLLTLLTKANVFRRAILASFDKRMLEKVKRIEPSMLTCSITLYEFTPSTTTDISAPLFPILWLNPQYVSRAHKATTFVSVWDPHPENRIQYYLDRKIDIVTGDSPDRIVAALSAV